MKNYKLKEEIALSRRRLEEHRRVRREMLRQYVGSNYGARSGSDPITPVNMVAMQAEIYARSLASANPKVLISPRNRMLRGVAENFELATNKMLEEMNFEDTLFRVALDAMFGLTCVKVGTWPASTIEIGGEEIEINSTFCDIVTLDDWVHDMSAAHWNDLAFMGNRYRMPLEVAREIFNSKKIDPTENITQDRGVARDLALSLDGNIPEREEPLAELWDIYLPHSNTICTYAIDDAGDLSEKLREEPWEGPPGGPYEPLVLKPVPGNLIPLAPIANTLDLHRIINSTMRKLNNQNARQKKIAVTEKVHTADADTVRQSEDGDLVALSNVHSLQELALGGIDQVSFGFLLQSRDIFSYMAGNLDALGGLGSQADTLGQEELISSSASAQIREMQKRMTSFTRRICKKVVWYLWNDPAVIIPIEKEIGGVVIPDEFSADTRIGRLEDYEIDIEPYSLQEQPPSVRLQQIERFIANFVGPMMPMMEQQGMAVDAEQIVKLYAKYTNMPEMNDIIAHIEPSHASGGQETGGMPAQTKRTYERVNKPGATRHGRDQIMSQALFGGNPQSAEKASAGRL